MEELKRFDPFWSLAEFGGEPDTSGINWSHAKFANADDRARYIAACDANGYRTRQVHDQAGYHFVQYHHYQD